jgi:uncharacterized membrane protein (UPF0136 family)
MHDFATKVLWAYVVLLLIGGLIGFFKAKSKVSLIMSVVLAAVLSLAILPGVFQPAFARDMVSVILALLLVVFAFRLATTRKFMPGGMMMLLTVAVLALRNIFPD